MDKNDLLKIFTRQQRIELDYPEGIREVDGSVIRHISRTGDDGFVIYSHLSDENADVLITAQIERFQHIPQDFEWKVYDYDPPSDLIERLRRHGFVIGDPEALMVLDLSAGPEALNAPAPPSVVRITHPDEIEAVVALENAVWETDHTNLGEYLKRELTKRPELLSVFISYSGDQPVSAAWTFFHAGSSFASLWGGATLPQFRGQGHYSALIAARAQEALSRGFTLLTVDASPMSRPILEKHGFQFLATTTPCICKNQVPAA
jgi:GNAT superfamily N-acetyltransferase